MKKKLSLGLGIVMLCLIGNLLKAQSVTTEIIDFNLLKQPKESISVEAQKFKVIVNSPYNLTAEQISSKAKTEHEKAVADYGAVVAESEKQFNKKNSEYDSEVVRAKEKFAIETAEFKKLSLFERLALTEQKKNPQLVIPAKPQYYKPAPPVYREPNLNNYLIADNEVLASQISIDGFTREEGNLLIQVTIGEVTFQDNAGQTYINQPTKLIIKSKGVEKLNKTFFQDFKFLTSSPTNNINKAAEERRHLNAVVKFLNTYLNEMYGFRSEAKKVKLLSVKNKGSFDDLERADIYVKTNLRKLQATNSSINAVALSNMQKGVEIWQQTLAKIDYKNPKAEFNSKIAQVIFFNLINLNIALEKKAEAEKYLNELQENLVAIKLSYEEKNEVKKFENEIYQGK